MATKMIVISNSRHTAAMNTLSQISQLLLAYSMATNIAKKPGRKPRFVAIFGLQGPAVSSTCRDLGEAISCDITHGGFRILSNTFMLGYVVGSPPLLQKISRWW